MRRISIPQLILSGCLLLMAGCGGGGGGSSTPAPAPVAHPPAISNLQFSPTSSSKGAGGGAISVGGSFNFTDTGGDLIALTVTNYYSTGGVASTGTIPITGASGATVGTTNLYLTINTTVADNFRFEAYATDAAGSKSNILSGTFLITDPLPTTHAPIISNFQFTPSTTPQGSGGGTVAFTGNFNFTDSGGDMTTVTYVYYNSLGVAANTSTGPITGIAGYTSGWVQSSFTGPTANVADYRIDVFTTDGKGSTSNTLSQFFKVVPSAQPPGLIEQNIQVITTNESKTDFMILKGAKVHSNNAPIVEFLDIVKAGSSEVIK